MIYLMLELCDTLRHAPSASIAIDATRATAVRAITSPGDVGYIGKRRIKGCRVQVDDLGLGPEFPSVVGV
jgi:hypothetical protein